MKTLANAGLRTYNVENAVFFGLFQQWQWCVSGERHAKGRGFESRRFHFAVLPLFRFAGFPLFAGPLFCLFNEVLPPLLRKLHYVSGQVVKTRRDELIAEAVADNAGRRSQDEQPARRLSPRLRLGETIGRKLCECAMAGQRIGNNRNRIGKVLAVCTAQRD
jgi:hypothetical protein